MESMLWMRGIAKCCMVILENAKGGESPEIERREHISVGIKDVFAGVLPRLRCPICLVRVHKSRWESHVKPGVIGLYAGVCERACSFQSSCCHDSRYTHLPKAFTVKQKPGRFHCPPPLRLKPSLQRRLPELRRRVRLYCEHQLTTSDVISFLETTFGQHILPEQQDILMEHLLPRVMDEERRAMLLLAYHAKYKVVRTRCCGEYMCFNCKRRIAPTSYLDHHVCDDGLTLGDDNIIDCRSCHVTMVKVEGCNAVTCWCGFAMDWDKEVDISKLKKRGLLPVDIFDLELYTRWEKWQRFVVDFAKHEFVPLRLAMRLSRLDIEIVPFRPKLRVMLQHYIWPRRFRNKIIPRLASDIAEQQHKMRLRRLSSLLAPYRRCLRAMVQRHIWKKRFTRAVPALREEIDGERLARLTRRLRKSKLRDVIAYQRIRVLKSLVHLQITERLFWANYHIDHPELLDAAAEEAREMLMGGLMPSRNKSLYANAMEVEETPLNAMVETTEAIAIAV
ncbi:hypothetical protein P43SY_006551 [Pythium insidiosum]|uniref:Uncharacterized protein n=1 Tax=Pythium insidiosum TaxID=114742 RepID=A0AAD5M7K3_PYTIN|nr:hypothetical protein P43SY_006551 [Pythium insidiosum]